jgi:arsenical pump membrane protein
VEIGRAGEVTAAIIVVTADIMHVIAAGVGKGVDVYLFLIGMMVLSELARVQGLFDWLAAKAALSAKGSATRLFALLYGVGVIVTVFLSNDATAVVLTPAVAAVTRAAKVEQPLPYLYICAFVANAASFVLPISNPANLVVFGASLPPLFKWIPSFALPSLLSIALTYGVLRWTQRGALRQPVAEEVQVPPLSWPGKAAAAGIVATALVLMAASGLGYRLGLPTCVAGIVTLGVVCLMLRSSPWPYIRAVSWAVLALVAFLFVLVELLDRWGVIHAAGEFLHAYAERSMALTAMASGIAVGVGSNVINNLPAGLMAGTMLHIAALGPRMAGALLIGVDLGPNLSVSGSLATLLWLAALRRDGIRITAWDFFKVGLWVMPPALLGALAGLWVT